MQYWVLKKLRAGTSLQAFICRTTAFFYPVNYHAIYIWAFEKVD